MPDAAGNIRGISVPAAAWERVFAQPKDEVLTQAELRVVHRSRSRPAQSARENLKRDSGPAAA